MSIFGCRQQFCEQFQQLYRKRFSQVFCFQALAIPKKFLKIVHMDREAIAKMLDRLIEEINSIKNALSLPSKPTDDVATRLRDGICLYCGLPLDDGSPGRPTRGVHARCYRKITRSKQSIDVHQAMGLIGPPSPGGRPPAEDRAEELAKKLLEEGQSAEHQKEATDFKKKVLDSHRKAKKKT